MSKKELPNSAKSNNTGTIEEDSALKYNDYVFTSGHYNANNVASGSYNNMIKNVLKDSSIRDSRTSEIKEEIIPMDDDDDDAYVPVDHSDDY